MSAMAKILVVEDEPHVREMLAFNLHRAEHEVYEAADAKSALDGLHSYRPDLVLVDWMLPEVSGYELLRRMRRDETMKDIPIIMLTARGNEADRVKALQSGADDYVTKPFSNKELVARIQVVLRRVSPQHAAEVLQSDKLTLNPLSHRVSSDGKAIDLGPTEFRLLQFFMSHPDRVFNRNQLIDRVWGTNVYVEERTVDVHIRRLRKALNPFGLDNMVQTVRGAGYRFTP